MNRLWLVAVVVVCPVIARAQVPPPRAPAPYQPVVPAASAGVYGGGYGGGWPGYTGGASTAAGSAMNGMASVISAAGNRNLSNSAAAVNMTQAQRNEIQNKQLATDTYFEMRATNKSAREAEAGPRPTMEQMVRMAQEGVPVPLNSSQWDPVTGRLLWPDALQEAVFAPQRSTVDQLFGEFAKYGSLSYANQMQVRQTIDVMAGTLKAQIREIPPMDFVACRTFLSSVLFAATKTLLQ